jgi:8-oxo-dGTP diphosphatase
MKKLLVNVHIALFTIRDRQLHVLLIRRLAKPFENRYALPGGFVQEKERCRSNPGTS